jgi:hypothetical protein
MNQSTNKVQGMSLEELVETESNGNMSRRSKSFNRAFGGVSPKG